MSADINKYDDCLSTATYYFDEITYACQSHVHYHVIIHQFETNLWPRIIHTSVYERHLGQIICLRGSTFDLPRLIEWSPLISL